MTRMPEYQRQGWRPHGPGLCRCPQCGAVVTTNALGRAAHREACRVRETAADLHRPKQKEAP